ncbi:MAG: VanW family protein, partial [Acutalibacteraceae bacterium]
MSNENNKKDINSQIDDILNEIRQQHNANAAEMPEGKKETPEEKPEQSSPEQEAAAEPQQEEEEEYIDISTVCLPSAQPEQATEKLSKKEKKEKKKAAKKAEKAAKAELSENTAEQGNGTAPAENNAEKAAEAAEVTDETAPQKPAEESEADKIISEIPSLINIEAADPAAQAIPTAAVQAGGEKPKSKKGFVLVGTAAVIVLLGCSFFAALALTPESVPAAAPIPEIKGATLTNEFVFAKGVSISGIDIGGKNLKEAKALIKLKESDFKEEFTLTVKYGDGKKLSFTQDDFTYTFNTDEVFEQAVQYSRDVSTAIMEGTLDQLVPPDKFNVKADAKKGTVDFGVSCIVSEASIDKVVNRSAAKIDKKAVEPHAEKYDPYAKSFDKMFKWVEGSNGTVINKEALTKSINKLFKNGAKSGEVSVETTTSKPKHKMDEVKNNVQLIGKFSTVSTNGYNANHNMATALEAIDGTIIDPGENFSFNECTGDSNLPENGYLSASVIMNEQYVPGIGGG